jgi:hypothetical protein
VFYSFFNWKKSWNQVSGMCSSCEWIHCTQYSISKTVRYFSPTLYDFCSKWWLFPRQHKLFSPSSGDFSMSCKQGYWIIGEFSLKGLIKWRLAYCNVFWYFFFNVTTLHQQLKGECGQLILPQQKCHYQPQDYRYYYNNITPSSPVTFYAI